MKTRLIVVTTLISLSLVACRAQQRVAKIPVGNSIWRIEP